MGVYDPNMNIPGSCAKCAGWGRCPAVRPVSDNGRRKLVWLPLTSRYDNCPLKDVRSPHGGLIDSEIAVFHIKERYCRDCNSYDGILCSACGIKNIIDLILSESPVIEKER